MFLFIFKWAVCFDKSLRWRVFTLGGRFLWSASVNKWNLWLFSWRRKIQVNPNASLRHHTRTFSLRVWGGSNMDNLHSFHGWLQTCTHLCDLKVPSSLWNVIPPQTCSVNLLVGSDWGRFTLVNSRCWDHVLHGVSVWLFWSAPGCDYCFHIFMSEKKEEFDFKGLNTAGVWTSSDFWIRKKRKSSRLRWSDRSVNTESCMYRLI